MDKDALRGQCGLLFPIVPHHEVEEAGAHDGIQKHPENGVRPGEPDGQGSPYLGHNEHTQSAERRADAVMLDPVLHGGHSLHYDASCLLSTIPINRWYNDYPEEMDIRAVLFDLDGTLFDHAASASTGLHAFVQGFGAEPTPALEQSWFDIEDRLYPRYLTGELSFQEQRRERLRQFLPLAGLPVPAMDNDLDDTFARYLHGYEHAWTAFPDVAPTLARLRKYGLTLGVITNGNHEQQSRKINRIGIEPLLDSLFSSGQMGHAKPASQAFTVPCGDLQLSPGNVLYVGDNFLVDVEGARGAGLEAVHLDRAGTNGPATIVSLTELVPLLQPGTLADAVVPQHGPTPFLPEQGQCRESPRAR